MNARLKIFAAALGLIVAAGTVADASADTIRKTVVTKIVSTSHTHRHAGPRFVENVRVIRRAPIGVRVGYRAPALVRVVHRGPVFVHVAKRTLVRHAMYRRPAKVVIIR